MVTGNTTELVVDSDQPDDFHRESDDGSFNQENGFSHTLLFLANRSGLRSNRKKVEFKETVYYGIVFVGNCTICATAFNIALFSIFLAHCFYATVYNTTFVE